MVGKNMLSVIIPTLNEEKNLEICLSSIQKNPQLDCAVIIVDGGSEDKTVRISKKYGAEVIVEKGCPEFNSRNLGATKAKDGILLFSCADVIFPSDLLDIVNKKFAENTNLIALSGPGIPFDAPLIGRIEYALYNMFRFVLARFPYPFRRFSTSTNFLVVKKSAFEKVGGFKPKDVNADGIMGKKLSELGKIQFSMDAWVYISARRIKHMGILNFNKHYLYVLENFFPELSRTTFLQRIKLKSGHVHKKMHEKISPQ